MVTKGIVLGHIIFANGIQVDKAKIELIANFPIPRTIKDVRSFLGHAGFYRRFIKDFSTISRPLCRLLVKDNSLEWSEDCQKSFDKLKGCLTSAPIMQPSDWTMLFELMYGTSDYTVGAVLGQKKRQETLCLRLYLVGSPIICFIDHAALKYLLSKKDVKPRLIR